MASYYGGGVCGSNFSTKASLGAEIVLDKSRSYLRRAHNRSDAPDWQLLSRN
jgi:hypothetical protein